MTIVKRESYRFKVPSKLIVKSQRGHHVVVKVNILCDECWSAYWVMIVALTI
jgi:hypothetical protein